MGTKRKVIELTAGPVTRRRFLKDTAALTGASLAGISGSSSAQEGFPTRPIEYVVCYGAGGGTDLMTRIVVPAVEKRLGVPMPISYKAGGDGTVGVAYALNKKPDGYTIFGLHQFSTFVGSVFGQLPYSLKDVHPICNWVDNLNIVVVQASSPFKTLKDLLDHAKREPGKLKNAVCGLRTSQGISTTLLWSNAGVDVSPIPMKCAGPSLTALLGGHVSLSALPFALGKPHLQSGGLRALAVLAKHRIDELPGIPSITELGYEEAPAAIAGAGIAAATPKDRIAKISTAFEQAMRDPEVLSKLKGAGFEPMYMNHAEFSRHISESHSKVDRIKAKLTEQTS